MDCREQLEGRIVECFGLVTGSDPKRRERFRSPLRSGDTNNKRGLQIVNPTVRWECLQPV